MEKTRLKEARVGDEFDQFSIPPSGNADKSQIKRQDCWGKYLQVQKNLPQKSF